jgi:hypothetical protein
MLGLDGMKRYRMIERVVSFISSGVMTDILCRGANMRLATSSPRPQPYVSTLTSMALL